MDLDEIPSEDLQYEKLIANRLRPGQFRFGTLFVVTLIVAVMMAFPRLAGLGYVEYFVYLYGILYVFSPGFGCLAAGYLPLRRWTTRSIVAAIVMLAIVAPVVTILGWQEGYWSAGRLVFGSLVCAWIPQGIILWLVWFLMMRC